MYGSIHNVYPIIWMQNSVAMHFGFSCSESEDISQQHTGRSTMRRILNAEKIMFRTDANGRVIMPEQRHDDKEQCDQIVVTLSVTPWGHFTNNQPRDRFYYDIGMSLAFCFIWSRL